MSMASGVYIIMNHSFRSQESGQDYVVPEKETRTTPLAPVDHSSETCEPCQSVECPSLFDCLAGVVPDRCGCCQVMAQYPCDDFGAAPSVGATAERTTLECE